MGTSLAEICSFDDVCCTFCFQKLALFCKSLSLEYCLLFMSERKPVSQKWKVPSYHWRNISGKGKLHSPRLLASLSNVLRTSKPKGPYFWELNQEELWVARYWGKQRSYVDAGDVMEDFVLLELLIAGLRRMLYTATKLNLPLPASKSDLEAEFLDIISLSPCNSVVQFCVALCSPGL